MKQTEFIVHFEDGSETYAYGMNPKEAYIRANMKFTINYCGWFYDPFKMKGTYTTNVEEDNVREAIKYFYTCYNSHPVTITDENGNIFSIKPHKGPKGENHRGERLFYWVNENEDVVYDQRELYSKDLTIHPIEIKENKPEHGWINKAGKFYECGFEGHSFEASELFHTGTIPYLDDEEKKNLTYSYNFEEALENRGWVKISSKRITFNREIGLTEIQAKTIIRYIHIMGMENYHLNYIIQSKEKIEDYLKKYL
ncbi:MAG: hypothetical protein GF317_20475 [Candidatus Lokiarchaeota archaeon]|nr:hypothetical protein [Candidatus Lokiarchaeota archaeon]